MNEEKSSIKRKGDHLLEEEGSPFKQIKMIDGANVDNNSCNDSLVSLSNHVSVCLSMNCSDCSNDQIESSTDKIEDQVDKVNLISQEKSIEYEPKSSTNREKSIEYTPRCSTSQEKSVEDEQKSSTNQEKSTEDEQKSSTNQEKSTEDEQKSSTNQEKSTENGSRYSIKSLIKDKVLLKGIRDLNLERFTKQQEEILLKLRESNGRNCFIKSSLFSNKELAYLIYAYDLIDPTVNNIQCLIIAPTAETVTFIYKLAKSLLKFAKLRVMSSSYMTEDIFQEISIKKPHILVSTLGCVISANNRHSFEANQIKLFIFEESLSLINNSMVDKRCSNIYKITNLNIKSQFVFLTSSFSECGLDLSIKKERLANMITLDLLDRKELFKNILNFIVRSKVHNRYECLSTVIQNTKFKKILINVNNSVANKYVSGRLKADFTRVHSLHGDCSHDERTKTIIDFIKADSSLLVVCYPIHLNVELEDIQMVINYDPANICDCYYQKISHLGRFDKLGFAINIITNLKIENEIRMVEKELAIKFIELRLEEGPEIGK